MPPGYHLHVKSIERRLLTVVEAADVLRTSPKAIYAMASRGGLPGIRRVGRRILIDEQDLLHWLDHTCAPSSRGDRR